MLEWLEVRRISYIIIPMIFKNYKVLLYFLGKALLDRSLKCYANDPLLASLEWLVMNHLMDHSSALLVIFNLLYHSSNLLDLKSGITQVVTWVIFFRLLDTSLKWSASDVKLQGYSSNLGSFDSLGKHITWSHHWSILL